MDDQISDAKLRVLEVAGALFMKHGYEAVKLRDIAEALDIRQPSLYYHFEQGKEQIYFEVVKLELQKLNQGLMDVILESDSDLRTTMYRIGEWAEENMAMSPVIMNKVDMPQISEENRDRLKFLLVTKIFSPISEMFERFIQRGEIRTLDTNVLTGLVLAALEAMDERINVRSNKQKAWQDTIDIILEGLLPRN